MDFIIDCEDERQQIQVLQKLEKKATVGQLVEGQQNLSTYYKNLKFAKLIITKPKITSNSSVKILAYATGREKK